MIDRRTRHLHACPSGFTLIELSIVLVVIGLIVGGVLVGRDLIKAAQLRSLLSETEQLQTAIITFQQKFDCLPGDCGNATDLWGASAGACNGFGDTNVSGTATCNGNNDGMIGDVTMVCAAPSATCLGYEYYRFWQHLSNSRLIKGSYSGISAAGTGTGVPVPGSNVPITAGFSNGCYSLERFFYIPSQVYPYWFTGEYGLTLQIGAVNDWNMCQDPIFTPAEALYLDTKVDDGLPGMGKLVTMKPSGHPGLANCATSTTAATASYKLSSTGLECSIMFRNMDP